MISRTNAGGGLGKSTLVVQTESGSVVTVSKETETRNAVGGYGVWAFPGLSAGEWTVKAMKDGMTATKTVTMDGTNSVAVSLVYSKIPAFSYSGDYEIVDDADTPITTSDGNWKIRFLTSGVFTPTDLRGAADGIDVFLVGGGGGTPGSYTGGAGGGYTNTKRGVLIKKGTSYSITVGAGGTGNATGGSTSAFDAVANGGKPGVTSFKGGDGGSGGGGYSGENDTPAGVGGSDGSDGGAGSAVGGKGQGTTTREFAETFGTLYAGGGGGGAVTTNKVGAGGAGGGANGMRDAAANTGGGAGGSIDDNTTSHRGGSGIVIIRNAREVG